MARVRLNETADVAEDHRWIFERIEQRGPILNIFRAMSHSPEAMLRFMRFGSYFLEQGKLDPKLRELAILRAGWICSAPYEFSQHIAFGRRAGLSDEQIRAIGDPTPALFNPQELAILAFAGEMSADSRVSDTTFDNVRQLLDEEQVVELALVTAFYNMVSRVLNTLEVDIDPPAQKDLDALSVTLPNR